MERIKTDLGRLWCRAEEPVPVGKNQSEIAQKIFSGTSMPCSGSLSFRQISIPIRIEPHLHLLRALTQKRRPTWYLLLCTLVMVELEHLRAM
eukprot:1138618-Pelagomonas_calceolata.AAC.3